MVQNLWLGYFIWNLEFQTLQVSQKEIPKQLKMLLNIKCILFKKSWQIFQPHIQFKCHKSCHRHWILKSPNICFGINGSNSNVKIQFGALGLLWYQTLFLTTYLYHTLMKYYLHRLDHLSKPSQLVQKPRRKAQLSHIS